MNGSRENKMKKHNENRSKGNEIPDSLKTVNSLTSRRERRWMKIKLRRISQESYVRKKIIALQIFFILSVNN